MDYIDIGSVHLVFTPENQEDPQCIYISILDDHFLEYPEYFSVHLSSSDSQVKIIHPYASIYIEDNDSKLCVK